MSDVLHSLTLAPFSLEGEALVWVRSTLAGMDGEARLRQLFNLPIFADDPAAAEAALAHRPGAVTRFVGGDLDAAWRTSDVIAGAEGVPLLVSADVEGGIIAPACGTPMPNQLALAAAGDPGLTAKVARVLAAEAAALGINWTLTPVLDINAAYRSAIVATRSFGSDVATIEAHALACVDAFQAAGMAATAKHWPGEGYDDRDQHLVTTFNPLDEEAWGHRFGRLYGTLVRAGVKCVMSAHIGFPAYARSHGVTGADAFCPASLSSLLNQRLLRGELGFNGLIVSDATGMAGFGGWAPRAEALPRLIESGCDMILFSRDFPQDLEHVRAAADDGRLSGRRIEEAVTRILGLKASLGLQRTSPAERLPPLAQAREILAAPDHMAVARRAASAAPTLVKDTHGTLPLDPARHRRVVVVTDPGSGFVSRPPLPLTVGEMLTARGFEVRPFDPDQLPTPDDTDLVLYLLAQESLLNFSNIFLDWQRLQSSLAGAMTRFWHDIPCVLVSFGHPYYLYDAPQMPCCVNAYTAVPPMQEAVIARLLGEAPFTGSSPVDPFCGLPEEYMRR